MNDSSEYEASAATLREYVEKRDVQGALRYLNHLTPHRFTGLYQFDDPWHKNVYLVDKLNPDRESVDTVPTTATYCAFVRAQGDTVMIGDSLADDRTKEHPVRDEVRSYVGVPLQNSRGDVFGTICHYDYDVVDVSDLNVQLLEYMAPLLEVTELKESQ